jgi:precorrin-2 dehydrogenase/sirohydrochlorin ferrochelatase
MLAIGLRRFKKINIIEEKKDMNKYYPMMINIKNKKCLVVGGGNVAYRKTLELIEYGAKVTVVSMERNEKFSAIAGDEDNGVIYIVDRYKSEFIKDAYIVMAATNDSNTNLQIAMDCEKRNILVNVVDDLKESRFIVPSKVKRGDLTITISTNGKCPFYSKLLRKKLEIEFDDSYGTFVNILGDFRKEILLNVNSASKVKDIMASLDMEYYITMLKEIGESSVKREMETHAHGFL